MIINNDLHIHTHCSCDSACAQLPTIIEAGKKAGFAHWGVSDHLHTRFNLSDIEIAAGKTQTIVDIHANWCCTIPLVCLISSAIR